MREAGGQSDKRCQLDIASSHASPIDEIRYQHQTKANGSSCNSHSNAKVRPEEGKNKRQRYARVDNNIQNKPMLQIDDQDYQEEAGIEEGHDKLGTETIVPTKGGEKERCCQLYGGKSGRDVSATVAAAASQPEEAK